MSKNPEVIFVVPGDAGKVFQGLAGHAAEPPVMTRWMASYLLRRGVGVQIIDAAMGIELLEVASVVSRIRPDLVVLPVYGHQPSASTQTMPAARVYSRAIKQASPEVPVLLTGIHPAALPERTLNEEESVDFVCDGEGPVTVYWLAQALRNRFPLREVPGLWSREDGRVVSPRLASPLVESLDEEPADLAWDQVPPTRYRSHDWHSGYALPEARSPYASIMTSLGCPFGCSFCCVQALFRSGERAGGFRHNSYRMWSPATVIREIDQLAGFFGVRHIKIQDEMFLLNQKHVLGIADSIAERYGDSLNIWAYARVDTVRPHLLDRLRKAGFRWLAFGIEAGSGQVRGGQNKKFGDEVLFRAIRMTEGAGINVAANYIFGLPGDDFASMRKTLELAEAINAPFANFYCAMAYPGSRLYGEAQAKGWSLPGDPGGPGWIGYSQYSYETKPLPTEFLSAAQVLAFRDRAWTEYYSRPEFLAMLRRKFGEGAVRTVNGLLNHPLKRKILGH